MKRWPVRAAKGLGLLLGAAALGLGAWSLLPVATRAIPGEWAVAEVLQVELGGFPQAVLARGNDRRNPRLLYLHGGPGSGQLPIARHYSDQLEQHFSVVHWDQRGAGASCTGVDWSTLSLERIVADTLELAEKIGDGEKIFLVGHSWGSLVGALAVQRRPELFQAYVGLGQLVHRDRQEQISYDWVVEQARRDGNQKALAELGTVHPPYTTQREFGIQRGWLDHYHGAIYAHGRARGFLPAAIFGREYSLATRLRYRGCVERSLEALLRDRLDVDLLTAIPRLEVPVFFFVGRHDWNTPPALVEEWAARLSAPRVELVWFEDAGHFLAIETPEAFQARLLEKLLPLSARSAPRRLQGECASASGGASTTSRYGPIRCERVCVPSRCHLCDRRSNAAAFARSAALKWSVSSGADTRKTQALRSAPASGSRYAAMRST